VSQGRFSLQPVFLGHLSVSRNSGWSAEVWGMSSYATVPNGTFVFTTSGLLAGLVIGQPETPAIVPADTVIALAQRLLAEGHEPPGWLGIDVQPLTPQIRTATGIKAGVVVTWVDPQGTAAGKIVATDIVKTAGENAIQTIADWEAGPARLTAGEVITLRVWRSGREEEVELTAIPPPAASVSSRLGLTMRVRPGVGAEVLSVEEGSVAIRSGIAVDDVLTRIGDIAAPTPAQVTGAFAAAKDRALLVAITRGTQHFVVGLVNQ
jgi:S1-C subfamily serine protease